MSTPAAIPLPSNARIVIPIVAGIGNALLAVPMVRQLLKAFPRAKVLVLARTAPMAEVFKRIPNVGEVRIMGASALAMARAMANTGAPDVCIIPSPSNRWQYMMLAVASRARRRLLHSYPTGHLRAFRFMSRDCMPAIRGLHDAKQNLRLLEAFGVAPDFDENPTFPLTERELARGATLLAGLGCSPDDRPIVVHAGSARSAIAAAKRWPAPNFAKLLSALESRFGQRAILVEGPDEEGVGREILDHCHASAPHLLRLRGPLAEAAAVLHYSRLYVGTDSGLAHLAAAVGTPPVTLFAVSDPERICPFGYRDLVVRPRNRHCMPCLKYPFDATRSRIACNSAPCINEIRLEDILAAVNRAATRPTR